MGPEDRVSVGCPVFGNQVECLDETGRLLGEGETGEICVRGRNVMRGYLGNPEATAAAFAFGWLHTGDVGHWDRDGERRFFFITGRKKDIIKCHGRLVSIAEVERRVAPALPASPLAVVGFPNDLAGEELGLVLEVAETPGGEDAILRRLVEAIGERDAPKAVAFGVKLPVTSTGKVVRRELVHHFDRYRTENMGVRLRRLVRG
jgi:acyl-CoA synthetase (AMP-forming)/AMP-acid ligase II